MNATRSPHLRLVHQFLQRAWRDLAKILALALLLNLLALALPRATQAIFDHALPTGNASTLTWLFLLLGTVLAFQWGLGIWRRIALVQISLEVDRKTVAGFVTHLLRVPVRWLRGYTSADLVSRTGEHSHVRHLLAGALTRAAVDAVLVLVYLAVMILYQPVLAGCVAGLLALQAGFTLLITPALKRAQGELLAAKARHETVLHPILSGIETLRATGQDGYAHGLWQLRFEDYLKTNRRTQGLRQLMESSAALLQGATILTVLGLGSFYVLHGELSIGELVAFQLYAAQALAPVLSLILLWDEAQLARAALRRIDEVLALPSEPLPATATSLPSVFRGELRVESVAFHYGDETSPTVLEDVSFRVAAGERVALVGESGGGKSTLVRLLLGLEQPTRGSVYLDGVALSDLDLGAFRHHTGVVLQEPLVLPGSLQENVCLGLPFEKERFHWALEVSHVHDFTASLPNGVETILGEGYRVLSAGQRQRLCLARAIYRKPRLLVLDEATTGLDRALEDKVVREVLAALPETTMIWVTHHRHLLPLVDRVITLERGRVCEEPRIPHRLLNFDRSHTN